MITRERGGNRFVESAPVRHRVCKLSAFLPVRKVCCQCGIKLNHSSQHPNWLARSHLHTPQVWVSCASLIPAERKWFKRVWPIEYSASMVGELLVVFLQGCSGRQCVTGMWDELIGRVFLLRARRQGFCAFEFLLVCSDEFEPLNWTVEYLAFISKSKDAWPCLPSTSKKRMNKLVDLAHVKSRKSRNQFRLWYQLPYWFHSTVRLRPISGATKTISI